MKRAAAKEKTRASGRSRSYPKTRVMASRLYEAAFILAIVELSRRLHQAYRQAYDKQAAEWLLPQKPVPGSFEACVGGLGGTGFNQEAADLINNISGKEGTSRDLLAVTWMNESSFTTRPNPMDNGHPENIMKWDVGPFQINIDWTLKTVAAKEVSFGGLNERNVFGYDFYRSDGKTPLAFTGDPLSNGRMGARRLNAIGGSDEDKAIRYTRPEAQPARKISYETYAGRFRDFFKCYHPQ